jgi:hypothetical protein
MRGYLSAALLTLIFLTGCTGIVTDPNTLLVDFVCSPEGATLYQDQQDSTPTVNLGTCPTTIQYKITDQDRIRGNMILRGVTAYWVSGASSSVKGINANLQNGLHQNLRFERPRSIPGYDVDANYALAFEKNRILRAQAEAEQNQAAIATWSNAIAAASAAYATPPPNFGTHCTTRYIGRTAYTDCY